IDGVAHATRDGSRPAVASCPDQGCDDEEDMRGEEKPKEWPRHPLQERPDLVAREVIDTELAHLAGYGAADMGDHRIGDLDAAPTGKAQAKGEVDILRIGEEPLVEAADVAEPFGTVESGRGARPECLGGGGDPRPHVPMATAPGRAGAEIDVAQAIEELRAIGADLQRAEHDGVG